MKTLHSFELVYRKNILIWQKKKKCFEAIKMAPNETERSRLEQRFNSWSLRSENYAKFTEECVRCKEKNVFVKTCLPARFCDYKV